MKDFSKISVLPGNGRTGEARESREERSREDEEGGWELFISFLEKEASYRKQRLESQRGLDHRQPAPLLALLGVELELPLLSLRPLPGVDPVLQMLRRL